MPITLNTSASNTPTIKVMAQLTVQQPVVVLPARITLPAGVMAAARSSVVTIRNNSATALALSDAKVNVPGADVRLQENTTNRQFRVTVQFPAGFELKPEDKVELSLKSNHPKFPVIHVPVVLASPAAPPLRTAVAKPVVPSGPVAPPQTAPK
jgi:hypothetical protein